MAEATRKIEITRATVCDGKDVMKGDVVTTSERVAKALMGTGKAVPAGLQKKESPKGKGSAKGKVGAEGDGGKKEGGEIG